MDPKIEVAARVDELDHLMSRASRDAVRAFLIKVLLELRSELTVGRNKYSERENDYNYASAVTLRGILDYLNLQEIVSRPNWAEDHQTLDLVWTRMWDCKDRMESYPGVLAGELIDYINNFISKLHTLYYNKFGAGMYFSPDLKVKRRDCTICKDNIKKCSHIPGRLYGGVMCRQMMVDFEIESVSIVANPEDPRCRIWPWKVNEKESTMQAPFITFFYIDDFIQDDPWPHPDTQWPEGTRRIQKIGQSPASDS